MEIGIVGGGAIATGYAGFLSLKGFTVTLWSPSGASAVPFQEGAPLELSGAVESRLQPAFCSSLQELSRSEVIILAIPVIGHKSVLDQLAPLLEPNHTVIISGHLSFAALYLSKKLAERGISIPIVAWNTTAVTCKKQSPTHFRLGAIRKKINMSVLPSCLRQRAHTTCTNIFGDVFEIQEDLLDIAISNLNPQSHLAIALFNLTRIERGEVWGQNTNMTASVHRFLNALDAERVEIAAALRKPVISRLEQRMSAQKASNAAPASLAPPTEPNGPKDMNTRYVLEDVPFGIAPLLQLADMLGVEARLHESGVRILNACYGRDLTRDNDILPCLDLSSIEKIKTLSRDGY